MTEVQYIVHFLRRNHEKMTTKEMAEKLGISAHLVDYHCKANNIKPVSAKEKTERLITENSDKSVDEISKLIGVTKEYVLKRSKAMGIQIGPPPEESVHDIQQYNIKQAEKIMKNPSIYPDYVVLVAENVLKTIKKEDLRSPP